MPGRVLDPAVAPRTAADLLAADLLAADCQRPYSRRNGTSPVSGMEAGNYRSPVSRIDNVHGDRNLVCPCPPIEDYQEAAE